MDGDAADPSDIRVVAVTAEDVVAAAETNRTSDKRAVLRVTPPFSGRMRARLHVCLPDDSDAETLHLDPESLLDPEAPPYPRPAATEDELRADPDVTYTVERHRDRHERAVEEWRSAISEAIGETVTIDTPDGPHDIQVTVLG